MPPRAILIGMPGVGKSTTGRRLAKVLDVPFADSDDLIEHATGRPAAEILREDGEPAFRVFEANAIADALQNFEGVLALGGGALETESTRTALEASGIAVVRLDATLATLAARVGDGSSRPLLAGNPEQRLAELEARRAPTLTALATITVRTDGRSPAHVASTIAAKLRTADSR
jgi:shikimate kinase